MEEESRKRRKWGEVRYALMSAIAFSGLLMWTAAAPNTLRLLKHIPKDVYRFNDQLRSGLSKMIERGEARMVNQKGKKYFELTDKGRRELLMQRQKFGELGKKKRRWDKRWRMVIFDIPETRAKDRKRLRTLMQSFCFYRLQNSVWVYPYDCEDVMALVKTEMRLGNAVRYVIADTIENDRELRTFFEL